MKDVIAKNKSLLQPILTALKLKWNRISVVENSYDKENWKITLDIDWKNVILSADMKFWYFAQCVNHMLLIDNISAEIPWEWAYVDFKSSVVRNWRVDETKSEQLYWRTKFWMDFATWVYREEQPEQPENTEVKTDDATQWGKSPETWPSGTEEVVTPPKTAWDGTDDIWGGDEV